MMNLNLRAGSLPPEASCRQPCAHCRAKKSIGRNPRARNRAPGPEGLRQRPYAESLAGRMPSGAHVGWSRMDAIRSPLSRSSLADAPYTLRSPRWTDAVRSVARGQAREAGAEPSARNPRNVEEIKEERPPRGAHLLSACAESRPALLSGRPARRRSPHELGGPVEQIGFGEYSGAQWVPRSAVLWPLLA